MQTHAARLALPFAAVLALALLVAAPAPASQRAYFADFNAPGGVPVFNVAGDGSLQTPTPFPVAETGASNETVALTPDGSYLFTSSNANLVGFPVDRSTGQLSTPVPTSTANAYGIVVTPNGRFVYQATYDDGTIRGFNLASDGSVASQVLGSPFTPSNAAVGLAVTPDGRFLYTANSSDSTVGAFAIGGDGSLTEVAGSPFPSAADPYAISISPDGRHLYVPGRSGAPQEVFSYDIAADGTLAQTPGSPADMNGGVTNSFGSVVTADGKYFFTTNFNSVDLSGFTVNADGSLTELAGSPFPLGSTPGAITSDADGSHLCIVDADFGTAIVMEIGADGVPTPITGSPFSVGVQGDYQAVALTPVQPPSAALTVGTRGHDSATLDASASTDSDGTIASYAWDFGDGTSATTTSPTITHTYGNGPYTATVTVTDSDGCSVRFTSSGQTAFCNGGPSARASAVVSGLPPEPPTPPAKTTLRTTAKKKQKLGKPVTVNVTSETGVKVSATGKATLKGAGKKGVKYKPANVTVGASGNAKLKLKLSGRSAKIARRARSGRAEVRLIASGSGGNATSQVSIKLK